LRVYGIAIKERVPVGLIKRVVIQSDSGNAAHPASTANLSNSASGYVSCGGGAEVHYNGGSGNLLWKLEPAISNNVQSFSAASKDHIDSNPSSITTYAMGIQLTQGRDIGQRNFTLYLKIVYSRISII
jgi:hypothetical protein